MKNIYNQLIKRIQNILSGTINITDTNSYESVYFFTFHKCASSLFSSYVLKNIFGLKHVDYASQIYNGMRNCHVEFKNNGYIYGPIRLSFNINTLAYKLLIKPASDYDFIRNKISIFLIRDPRDILVSAYYSFGKTHGFSAVNEIRKTQVKQRLKIQESTIDEYVLATASDLLAGFEKLERLDQECGRSVVLKYEDMINNWDEFVAGITKYIEINQKVLLEIFDRTRPPEEENMNSHRRSGKPGSFRAELMDETIDFLNTTFEKILVRHKYIK